jgi:hypothetical protein
MPLEYEPEFSGDSEEIDDWEDLPTLPIAYESSGSRGGVL